MKFIKPFEDMSRCRLNFALRIRIFNPRGQYPRGTCASEEALYLADDEIVFTVVHARPYDQMTSNFPYSEMDWATPQEVRFWASILLCEDAEGPKILLYPEHTTFALLDPPGVDLKDSAVQNELRVLALEEFTNTERLCAPYQLFESEVHLNRQPGFLSSVGASDHVLLRGITCLIKCDMLSRYYEFTEEAIIVACIALEASFSLVVKSLKYSGIDNPTARDAGKWLDDTFNRPLGIDPGDRKYFEELYEQRVMTMHPSSRFGESPYAPLAVDDLFDLRRDLREVFAYLVSGGHGPEFKRRLKERRLA
ncbi:hypothetical protein [Halomonas daqiaonensis]|uniref:Apea-like HEPN domain-containing protein n=1 Tax=Halomonas daqiaonensis TaxID=650850 RepID=A0A1H7WNY2_9GAMM|nr:hypothetical protein [Halomonas daqiaonensis]SEM23200.1 hypothetical protein SAMN04488129_1382 [Halomonas daqiaonensis]